MGGNILWGADEINNQLNLHVLSTNDRHTLSVGDPERSKTHFVFLRHTLYLRNRGRHINI